MTSGDPAVTNGGARALPHIPERWRPYLVIAVMGLVVGLVNVTSELLEAGRDGEGMNPRGPFLWELSSYLMLMALAPAIGWAVRRWPPRTENLLRTATIHAALTVPFSIIHVAGMVAIRKLGYWSWGGAYDFAHGALAREFVYEWRKDVLSYVLLGAVFWFFNWRAAQQAAPQPADRIEIRDGAAAIYLAPAEIFWIEAAGNYVEVHAGGQTHLVRGTLAAFERRLGGHGFARVHRSRIVNRARIRQLKPTSAGDVEITFDDGRTALASRRYRAALERASQ